MLPIIELAQKLISWDQDYVPRGYMAQAGDALIRQQAKIEELKAELETAYGAVEEAHQELKETESELYTSYLFGYERGKEDARKAQGDA